LIGDFMGYPQSRIWSINRSGTNSIPYADILTEDILPAD